MNDFLHNLRSGQTEKQRPQKTRKSYDNSHQYKSSRFQSFNGYQNNRNQQQMHRSHMQQRPQSGNQVSGNDTQAVSMLYEAIENLGSHIDNLAKNQDSMAKAIEKTDKLLERQIIAVEGILSYLSTGSFSKKGISLKKTVVKEDIGDQDIVSPKSGQKKSGLSKISAKAHGKASIKASGKASGKTSGKTVIKKSAPVKPAILKRKKTVVTKAVKKVLTKGSKLMSREAIMDIIHTMRAEGATFGQVALHLVELEQPTFSGRGEWHAQTVHRLCNK